MKTTELLGTALDWAAAKCESKAFAEPSMKFKKRYSPSTEWNQGGPIIEREHISTEENGQGYWNARIYRMYQATGDTPLIAAMRCYVASKLGDNVEIPKELTQ